MKHCCEDKADALAALRGRQGRVLKIVLAVNAIMFVVEVVAGVLGRSTALLGDSLDMFGDAFVYGVTLFALHRSAAWKAKAAVTKGVVMAIFAVGVLAEVAHKVVAGVVPAPETMGGSDWLPSPRTSAVFFSSCGTGKMTSTCGPRGSAHAMTSSRTWP